MPFIDIKGKKVYYLQTVDSGVKCSAILFIHGAGGTGHKWANQISGIDGYNLIALDLPGHGQSEGEAEDSIINYRNFIWQFVLALELEQFVIAGHSMGGAIAMEFALKYPGVLRGMIIVDSGARLRVNPETLKVLIRGQYPLENIKFSYSLKASPEILDRAVAEMQTMPTRALLEDFRACDSFNIMERVSMINLPTLILCGQDDQMTPVKYSEYLAKHLVRSLLVLIPDAGHNAMVEQPKLVNMAITEYMNTLDV
ncbi:alpha/beta fold hydrolase [Desulfosporosinus fructosivorans]